MKIKSSLANIWDSSKISILKMTQRLKTPQAFLPRNDNQRPNFKNNSQMTKSQRSMILIKFLQTLFKILKQNSLRLFQTRKCILSFSLQLILHNLGAIKNCHAPQAFLQTQAKTMVMTVQHIKANGKQQTTLPQMKLKCLALRMISVEHLRSLMTNFCKNSLLQSNK